MPESAVAAPVEVATSVEAVAPPTTLPTSVTSEKAVAKVKIDLKTSRLTSKQPIDVHNNLNNKKSHSVGFTGIDNNNTIINNSVQLQQQHDQQNSNQDLGNTQEVVSVSKDLNQVMIMFGTYSIEVSIKSLCS